MTITHALLDLSDRLGCADWEAHIDRLADPPTVTLDVPEDVAGRVPGELAGYRVVVGRLEL